MQDESSTKKPLLPKELTTVTKISKTVALVMFIMLPLIGFLLGRNYQMNTDSANTTNLVNSPTAIPLETIESKITPFVFPDKKVSPIVIKTYVIDDISQWKTYQVTKVGLEFKLPASFGDFKEATRSGGQAGTFLCMQSIPTTDSTCRPSGPMPILINARSVDFLEAREGGFTDFQGFVEKDNKYYAKFGKSLLSLTEKQTKIVNASGVEILKVKGNKVVDGNYSLSNSVAENSIGLIINSKDNTYTGLTMVINLDNTITEKVVDQIISTIRLTR